MVKKNGLIRVFELSKFLEFPVFKEEGLNREILRSWIGRKILTELSKTLKFQMTIMEQKFITL